MNKTILALFATAVAAIDTIEVTDSQDELTQEFLGE